MTVHAPSEELVTTLAEVRAVLAGDLEGALTVATGLDDDETSVIVGALALMASKLAAQRTPPGLDGLGHHHALGLDLVRAVDVGEMELDLAVAALPARARRAAIPLLALLVADVWVELNGGGRALLADVLDLCVRRLVIDGGRTA